MQGLFSEKQKSLSINTKELLVIYYTLGAWASDLKNEIVHLKCDNMCALFCISKFGSRDKLHDHITVKIYTLAEAHNIKLQISYVKSAENKSDKVSREFNIISVHSEWILSDIDFTLCMACSIHTQNIDMFASNHNKKFPQFMSWKPCINSMQVNWFATSWTNIKGYLFPCFSMISRCIKKMYNNEVLHLCGVFPNWQTRSWYPALLRLTNVQIHLLPRRAAR